MGRARKPTNVLKMQGVAKNHPERINEREKTEPKCDQPLQDPPKYLKADEVKIWHELAELIVPGVLTAMDSCVFEITVRLMYKFRKNKITAGELGQLTKNLANMGLTPADRSKVVVAKPDKPTGWDNA